MIVKVIVFSQFFKEQSAKFDSFKNWTEILQIMSIMLKVDSDLPKGESAFQRVEP